MNIKRVTGLLLAVIISSTLFVGCGSTTTVQEDANTINVWANMRTVEVEGLQKLADKWSTQNNKKVKIVEVSTDGKGFVEAVNRPDVILGASAEETQLLSKALAVDPVPKDLIPAEKYISNDLVQATSIEGVEYGVPLTQECVSLFYNKDKVDTVPKTMEELIEVAKEKGFSFELNNYYFSFGIIASQGGYTFKNNNGAFDCKDLGVNNQGALKGYQFIQDMVVKDNLFLGGATDMMASSQFKDGKTAFYIGETGRVRTFKEAGLNFGVTTIPTVNGNAVTPFKFVKMACVNSKSEKKEESWSLIKSLLDESDEIFMESGPYPPVLKKSTESDTFKNNEYVKGLYNQSLSSIILPNVVEAKAIDIVVNSYLNRLALGQITPEECGEYTEKDIKKAITDLLTY